MKKSALQPRSRNTPSGGRMMAKMILMMSLNPQSVITVLLCPLHDFPAHESPPQHGKGSGADAGGSGLQSYMGTHLAVKGMMAVVSKKVTVGSG